MFCHAVFRIANLQEFNEEKIFNIYEIILTSPISLLKLYYSKLISLFILAYPTLICTVTVTILLDNSNSFNIPIEVMLMVLLLIPLYMLLYYVFGLWLILRFKNLYVLTVLSLTELALVFLGIFAYKYLSNFVVLSNGSVITSSFLVYAFIILIIGFLINFITIKKFNKENI
ncbi:MAG: hypothetical protein LBT66_03915 [Methanobrevibacter sp.]|jgi:hypothetical protein|nr:hypothetical protein [Candidatus Methanovirga meridionalis]